MAVVFARSNNAIDDEFIDDEGTLQFPALPIGDGEPGDESLPPEDGLEYLRRVRKQQQELPAVVRAHHIDPERVGPLSKAATQPMTPDAAPKGSTLAALAAVAAASPPRPPAALRPRKAWQKQLLDEFGTLREQVQRQLGNVASRGAPSASALPDPADTLGWVHWCEGRSGSVRTPSLTLLAQVDQARAIGLLRGVQLALERAASSAAGNDGVGEDEEEEDEGAGLVVTDAPSAALGGWAFAALARIDPHQLDADACATIRGVFSACLRLRNRLAEDLQKVASRADDLSNGKAKTPLKKGDNIVVVDGEHAKRCGVVSAMDPDGDMYVRLKEGPKQPVVLPRASVRRVEDATEAAGGGGDGDAPPSLEVARRHVSVELEGKGRVAALNVLITIAGGFFHQAPREEWEGGGG